MPVVVQGDALPLPEGMLSRLWDEVRAGKLANDTVAVRFVNIKEIRRLNATYRDKDAPTNVLTFSYGQGEHDVALCLEVAEAEASAKGLALEEYVALLMVHAFLHAAGMDHERSPEEAEEMQQRERAVLEAVGYAPVVLE